MEPKCEIPLLNELLAEIIFKYMPVCQWSGHLELVSKQFQSAVLAAYGRIKSINLRKLYSLKRRMKNCGKNRQLIFPEETATSQRLNNILNKLTTLCPNLREVIGFEHITCNVDAETFNILKEFSRLKSISIKDLQGHPIPFERFADFVVSKEIKILYICSSGFYGDGTLNVGSLESITIERQSYSNGEIFLENLSKNLTTLNMFTFGRGFQSLSKAEQEMSKCPNLKSFSLYIHTKDDCDTFFKILPNLPNLPNLSISHSPRCTCLFDTQFCNRLDFLKNQLRVINISYANLSDEAQIFLFSKCPRLESLKVAYLVSPLSANALQNLSNLPDELKKLTFSDPDGQIFQLLMPKFDVEKEQFALKPMNCPGHCLMFDSRPRTHKQLPLRYADFGVLHRNNAEDQLRAALNKFASPWKENPGDGAFYGPKIDIMITDALRREHQCATIQLDFQLPLRFKLSYTDEHNTKQIPVMIHRAILGSVERQIAVLTESYGGKWPFWLSPRQALVVPVHSALESYAKQVQQKIYDAGFECEMDIDEGDTLNKKIRNGQLAQFNFILVVGEKEAAAGTVNVRTRDNKVHGELTVDKLIEKFRYLKENYVKNSEQWDN